MRKLHPATIVVALLPRLREAVQAAFPILIGSFASGHSSNDWIAVVIGSFTGIFAIGSYWTTRFDIEPDHVVHRTGWIFRKDRRIPLEQIQNVNIHQNVLERIFRVATVDVETAMGKGRDLKLSVLGLADAERFREELLGAAHLGTGTAPKLDEPLVTLNRHDLFWGAVTENHLAQMFLGTATISGPVIGFLFKYTAKQPPMVTALAFGLGIIGLLLGTWLWGVAGYYAKYGGFVVRRNENVFRISYGLLNKVQMAIRPERIEFVQMTTTIPQRMMRRTSLRVGTASTFGEAGVLAPVALFVERYRAYAGIADVIPGLDVAKLQWKPFHPLFYRISVIRGLVLLAVVGAIPVWVQSAVGGVSALVLWGIFALVALLVALRLATLFLARPENGFAITEDALVVRWGYLHQTIAAMPISRMENLALTQPMWWKKHSAVTVGAQAMKHSIRAGTISEAESEELMARWRESMKRRDKRKGSDTVAAISQDSDLPLFPAIQPEDSVLA